MIKKIKTNWKQVVVASVILTQLGAIILLLSLLSVSQLTIKRYQANIPTISSTSISEQRTEVIRLVNEIRRNNNLDTLRENPQLTLSAQNKACHMVQNNYFDHIDPQGNTTWHFFREAGYNYVYGAENLATGHYADSRLMDAWMNSPTHALNILNPIYTDTGVGICDNFIVQHFGAF